MTEKRGVTTIDRGSGEDCHIRVWSGACDHGDGVDPRDRFRCDACTTISGLDHEVSHDGFPHVSGDYDNLY
jgi:hypothetical protein